MASMLEILAENNLGKGDIKKYFRQISQGILDGNRWSDQRFKEWLKSREQARVLVKVAKRSLKLYH